MSHLPILSLLAVLAMPAVGFAQEVAPSPPDPAPTPVPFEDGVRAGKEEAQEVPIGLLWGGCGVAGGTLCSVPGALGATGYAALKRPLFPKTEGEPEWLRGYEQGYGRTIRKRRAAWAAGGGAAGAVAGFAAFLVWVNTRPGDAGGENDGDDLDIFLMVGIPPR